MEKYEYTYIYKTIKMFKQNSTYKFLSIFIKKSKKIQQQ